MPESPWAGYRAGSGMLRPQTTISSETPCACCRNVMFGALLRSARKSLSAIRDRDVALGYWGKFDLVFECRHQAATGA